MTDIDVETGKWLQSLKLNKNFKTISDFENGYAFGLIFEKLQLSKGKKFKNSSDMACVFHNYKNVRDLLMENFNHDFPINNIIYRTQDLLKVIRDQTSQYQERKKQATLKAVTSVKPSGETLIQPQEQKNFKSREKQIIGMKTTFLNQTSKLPKKIQDIEKKLDKFREEKTKHELFSLQDRKYEIEQQRRMIQNHREYEMNKIRQMHANTKDFEKKVYDVWAKTEQIKHNRVEKDQAFNSFMKEKKDKLHSSLRQEEMKTFTEGLEAFQLNCIRHGIELDHDPDKPLKPQGEFNKVVVMERIKDNIKKHNEDKKQIKKRQNKKRVDAMEAKLKSEELWNENNKLEDYQAKMNSHFLSCEHSYKEEQQMEAEKETIRMKTHSKTYVDLPAIGNEEERAAEYKKRNVDYLRNDVEFLEKKYKNLQSMAEEVVEALLQATIEGEDKFNETGSFSYFEWKEIEKIFLSHKNDKKRITSDANNIYTDHSNFTNSLLEYIKERGAWTNFHYNKDVYHYGNQQLASTLNSIISISYPDLAIPQKSDVPLHMPLKVVFTGKKLAGKSTHSSKLAEKFGLPLIDPNELLKEAIEMAKPPTEEDPKKAKKDAKKPEEMTPERLALKEFGQTLISKGLESHEKATVEDFINVIKLRIKQLYSLKEEAQILEEFENAKVKQEERHAQALKQFEEGGKKPKKDSKKSTGNQVPDEPPKPNELFYASGFVIDNYPLCFESMKVLERQLNAYIADDEKINQNGEEVKEKFSLLVPIPQRQIDNRLKNGTFDHVFELEASEENVEKRKTGRKIDPATKLIYHPEFNPVPTQIKGFAEKLVDLPAVDSLPEDSRNISELKNFYSVFGDEREKSNAFQEVSSNETIDETFENICSFIKKRLLSKYSHFNEIKEKTKQNQPSEEKVNEGEEENKEPEKEEENKQPEKEEEKKSQHNQQQEPKQQQEKESEVHEEKQEVVEPEKQKSIEELINKLPTEKCFLLIQRFDSALNNYTEGIKECMHLLESQRGGFEKNLLVIQKQFTNLINRPDDKAGKILAFQQNYNKLLNEQENIVRDIDASRHLIKKLDQLYDSFWDSLCAKKNEAVEERHKFLSSDWLDIEGEKLISIAQKLLQNELNLLCETIFFILTLSCEIQEKSSEYVTEYLCLGIAPHMEPIYSVSRDQIDQSDRLDYFSDQVDRCIESLPPWIDQKRKKMKLQKIQCISNLLDHYVRYYQSNMDKKKNLIKNKIKERLLEERAYYDTLVNKMDEWIIQGIKSQNDFVYEIYKGMKKSIEEARRSNVKDLFVKEITDTFTIIKEMTASPMPIRGKTHNRSLPIYSYMVFLLEIKSLTNQFGKINFQILKKYLSKRQKSKLLDARILNINYDTVSQFLVKDGYLEFKELAIAIVLWNINVFDDYALARYRSLLLKEPLEKSNSNSLKQIQSQEAKSEKAEIEDKKQEEKQEQQGGQSEQKLSQNRSGLQKKASFLKAEQVSRKIYFNDLILMDGAFDQEEEYILKHFIFQIFKQESSDYIDAQQYLDTLSLFDQLQVLRYGDTVMLLD